MKSNVKPWILKEEKGMHLISEDLRRKKKKYPLLPSGKSKIEKRPISERHCREELKLNSNQRSRVGRMSNKCKGLEKKITSHLKIEWRKR